MRKIRDPLLFSVHFGTTQESFLSQGLIEPILNVDTKLFVDPLLIQTSKNPHINGKGFALLKQGFGEVVKLLQVSKVINDAAWRGASKRLNLDEAPQTCLGYGTNDIGGRSSSKVIKATILATIKEITGIGVDNPELISLMGMLEGGVGADTVSDLTTNLIMPALQDITIEFLENNKIDRNQLFDLNGILLPKNPSKENTPIVFVPFDILRPLPIATDKTEISKVVQENRRVRDGANALFADITKLTLTEMKEAIRTTALSSKEAFEELLDSMLMGGNHYDPNEDEFGFNQFRFALAKALEFKGAIKKPQTANREELLRVVKEITEHFKRLVENNNLWEMLWYGGKPRRERAGQLLYYGIADSFCRANDFAISPETNAGGGPVDFKFDQGYTNTVLVEVKLSTGRVVHGYHTQIEVYKDAHSTDAAIFLIIDVGKMGKKLDQITAIQRELRLSGIRAPEILVVDAMPKESASTRR